MKLTKDNYDRFLPSLRIASRKMKGSERRKFLGQLVLDIGLGGHRLVSKTLGVSRHTLRKGIKELESGEDIVDKYNERGRHQTDPQFKSSRLYTRLSARSVSEELLNQGYCKAEIPSEGTIYNIMKRLGYKRRKVGKTKPKKNKSH